MSSSTLLIEFVYSAFCYGHTIRLTNMFIKVPGIIYQNNIMNTNLYGENITADAEDMIGGFIYDSNCNLPGDQNLGEIELRNIYGYNKGSNPMPLGFMTFAGSANFTGYNITLDLFSNDQSPYPVGGYFPSSSCSPQDDVSQHFIYDLLISKLTYNPTKDKISGIGFIIPTFSTRSYDIIMKNSRFDERVNESLTMMGIIGSYTETLSLTNVTSYK